MKVLFSGGGTLGPVTPLLAIKGVLQDRYPDIQSVWIGTMRGPEREIVERQGIRFVSIQSGKLRRYMSPLNIFDFFRIIVGFFQSLRILWKEYPDVCISAGGFVSVPVHFAAWLLGIPTWIHQQDVEVGFANRLMVPGARVITTSLKELVSEFPKRKTMWLGNPVRSEILQGDKKRAQKIFGLTGTVPVVLALGGGTGSLKVNQLIVEAIPHLKTHAEVIHLSGRERPQEIVTRASELFSHYHLYQFLDAEMKDAYAVADVIVCRGGFGTLTEGAALKKPCIIIPKPGHQVENVRLLEDKGAALVVNELTADGLYVAKKIRELLADEQSRHSIARRMHETLKVAQKEEILKVFEYIRT